MYICAQLLVKAQAPSIEHKYSVRDLSLIYLHVQHNKIPVLVHMLWMLESFALVSIVLMMQFANNFCCICAFIPVLSMYVYVCVLHSLLY